MTPPDRNMKILGYYHKGVYKPYTTPKEVVQYGDNLLNSEKKVVAIKGKYGIWVHPKTRVRVTSPIEVIDYVALPEKKNRASRR